MGPDVSITASPSPGSLLALHRPCWPPSLPFDRDVRTGAAYTSPRAQRARPIPCLPHSDQPPSATPHHPRYTGNGPLGLTQPYPAVPAAAVMPISALSMTYPLRSSPFTRTVGPYIVPRLSAALSALRPIHTSLRLRRYHDDRAGDPLFRPSPPPLPAAEQREFEELVRAAAAGQSAPPPASSGSGQPEQPLLHPDARKKPRNEFEGDVNPKTGEIGGPKIEPVRHNDWSYGGRVTDF
ncbi:hypothetical protein CALCODRAFT_490554 [Calocera cornea HHB12733]|uniref:Succinate dehydrogenase assembly factor 4, mitochondrial n=1 Tax=Calocera cornea HHB12733 TaxID=1353952 RepID=A0A165JLN8_9BASI|nr:hypothetical protein CALCODRAFT_490554 [Calocera cornea HHB12733]